MEYLNVNIVYNGKNNKLNEKIVIKKGTELIDIKKNYESYFEFPVMLAKINNENFELHKKINFDCEIEFLDVKKKHSYLTYKRSVVLLMLNSARKILGQDSQIAIKYSINQNWYCEVKDEKVTDDLVLKIKEDMKNVVAQNLKIEKISIPTQDCIELFEKNKMYDRVNGLRFVRKTSINIYKIEDTYDYLYGSMAIETGQLDKFDIIKNCDNSFVLCFLNRHNPNKITEHKNIKKLNDVFNESSKWAETIGIDYVSDLNSAICSEKIREIILMSEALQEKKISNIADIISERNNRVVLIAGPSSSGKTTFANRLSVQLKVNGIKPYVISLDDYYLDREKVPLDENGNHDFECLEALNLSKISEDIENLLKGQVVTLPKFNFTKGKSEEGKTLRLEENEIIILEGIHGLNETISHNVLKQDKFKIFISALTQLNIDSHNRIPTTDARIFRRMVRDHYFRGFGVNATIKMWADVIKGEVKHIFPFQEEADVILNSALIYELAVLKPLALPLLYKISSQEPEYTEATRLIKFLDNFLPIGCLDAIPSNSIIREFIGGSCF